MAAVLLIIVIVVLVIIVDTVVAVIVVVVHSCVTPTERTCNKKKLSIFFAFGGFVLAFPF